MRKYIIPSIIIVLALGLLGFILVSTVARREPVVTIHTDFGDIVVILFDETPKHKENFVELAKGKFYDGTTFHRIIDGFMIQGGDPNSKDYEANNDGMGGPGYKIPAEFNDSLTHVKGALAAARQADDVNPEKESNGSQFYIIEADEGAHFLDGKYTVFGQTISGIEVIEEIVTQPKDPRDRPVKEIRMTMEVKKMSKKNITKEYGYVFKK